MAVKLTCDLATSCQGAFVLCLRNFVCNPVRTVGSAGGRLAASDFTLRPNETGEVPIAITTLGEQLASLEDGFPGDVLVDLRNYGIITLPAPPGTAAPPAPSGVTLRLTTKDRGFAPPGGAVASCGASLLVGQAPLLVGPKTSCGLANAVYTAYMRSASSVNMDVAAKSPVTGQTYTMHCLGESPHICTSQNGSLVVWY